MKTRLEKPIDLLGEVLTKNKTEYSRWQPVQQTFLLPVDRAGRLSTIGFPTVRKAVDRSSQTESEHSLSVDRNKQRALLFLPVDRCIHMHIGRPAGRPEARAVLSVCSGRPSRSTDREFALSVWEPQTTVQSTALPTVRNPTLAIDRAEKSADLAANGYILFCFLLGLLPTDLLGFLPWFSFPINRGSVIQLKDKIYKP